MWLTILIQHLILVYMKTKTIAKTNQLEKKKRLPRRVYTQTILEQRDVPTLPDDVEYVMSVDPGREGCASLIRISDKKVTWRCAYEDKVILRAMMIKRRKDTVFVMEDPTAAVRGVSGHSNPKTVFRFGKNTGWFEGAVFALTGSYPVRLSPQLWMKTAGLIGFAKGEVCDRVRIIYGKSFNLKRTNKCTTDWIDYAESIMIGLAYLDMTSDYLIMYI